MDWELFTKRTDDPKLAWIEGQLDLMDIPHRRNGHSFHGPILEVPSERYDEAWSILTIPVFLPDGTECILDDIPDDDPRFQEGGETA